MYRFAALLRGDRSKVTAYSSQSRLAALLRCGPLCWQVLPLRDRSKGFLIPIPPSKSFHALVNGIRLALVIGIVGDVGFAPSASIILFFPNQLTIVLVDSLPSDHFFCSCFG